MPEPASRPRPKASTRWPHRPCFALLATLALALPAAASDTYLLDIYSGSSRSDLVHSVRTGSYELADGEVVRFDDWYAPVIPDLTLLMLTELTSNLGLIWGVSLGEKGEKYRIDPALHLGFTWQLRLSDRATLSTSLHTLIGGNLHESSCSADYGIFGVSEVNCRLAASLLPPEETLDYMLDTPGWKDTRLSIRFEMMF